MAKKVVAYEMVHMQIDCKVNDSHDISCGGAPILGFDFYVEPNKYNEIKKFVEEQLKENDIPLIRITKGQKRLVNEDIGIKKMKQWIKETIEKNAPQYQIGRP